MDEYYRVPLSSGEVLAILAALRAVETLLESEAVASAIEPGVLRSAADRIRAQVPDFVTGRAEILAGSMAETLRDAAGVEPEAGDPDRPPFPIRRTRRLLEDAFERRLTAEIEYFVASRSEWTTRHLEITDVHEMNDIWYVSGHCGLREDFRRFRLDHIRSVRVLDDGETAAAAVRDPFVEE